MLAQPPTEQAESPRLNVLGVGISAVDIDSALDRIDGWIRRRESQYVCVATVHGVMECQRDPSLRSVFNASGLTTPDGMPLVWLSWLYRLRHVPAGVRSGPDARALRAVGPTGVPSLFLRRCPWCGRATRGAPAATVS